MLHNEKMKFPTAKKAYLTYQTLRNCTFSKKETLTLSTRNLGTTRIEISTTNKKTKERRMGIFYPEKGEI